MMERTKQVIQLWKFDRWIESAEPRVVEASRLCKNPNCNRIIPSRKSSYWNSLAMSLGLKIVQLRRMDRGYCSPLCKKHKNKPGIFQFSIGGPCGICGGLGAVVIEGRKYCWDCYESK